MKLVAKIAIAAVAVTALAGPAMAGEWVYHGGPRPPDSMSWYQPIGDDGYGYYGDEDNYAPNSVPVPYDDGYAEPDDDD